MALTKVSYSLITGASTNVLDFGADPTGVTDSTAAFTAAKNASWDTTGGAGTVDISATLVFIST